MLGKIFGSSVGCRSVADKFSEFNDVCERGTCGKISDAKVDCV